MIFDLMAVGKFNLQSRDDLKFSLLGEAYFLG